MNQPIIEVKNLETVFQTKLGPVRAVDDVSYSIERGKTLGVVGESGCGKSVTSLSIMGLIENPGRVAGGEILFDGTDLVQLSDDEMRGYRGNRVAMIFQEPMTALNPVMKVGVQLDEQIRTHNPQLSKKEIQERSIEMLKVVGIPSPSQRYHNYPHQLSGGMRQRAMIAMALTCNPEFLIADEPTTALDVTIQAQILELIQEMQEKFNMAVQFITHDLGVISEMADEILVMYAGQVCEFAPAKDVFDNPQHPYTRALLKSIPRLGAKEHRLPTISGNVPSLLNKPKGCPFKNRCPNAIDRCAQERPAVSSVSSGHKIACFNPTGSLGRRDV